MKTSRVKSLQTLILFFLFSSFFTFSTFIYSKKAYSLGPTPPAACHGQSIFQTVVNICWDCLFPMTIGSTTVEGSDLPDTDNPDQTICKCGVFPYVRYGLAMGYWEPMGLIDVTRTPYCMVNLGGTQFTNSNTSEGAAQTQNADQDSGFYYVHFYNFPIMNYVFPELSGGESCNPDGELMIEYASELDPTWKSGTLAQIMFPETALVNNPISQAACAVDSAKANFGLASDDLFWCAGSQGTLYPVTGEISEDIGSAQSSTLISERAMLKLHRLGFISDTSKDDLCHEYITPSLQKSRYRYQMIYPTSKSCQPFGRSTMRWEAAAENPVSGDDAAYLIWRKRNCCNY